MAKVQCSIQSCSYNQRGNCHARNVVIGGNGAGTSNSTCCGSFLNRDVYSNLATNEKHKSVIVDLACSVGTCLYNQNEHCALETISIGGTSDTLIYTETQCQSFQAK